MNTILQDVRYAFRTLARRPAFTAVAVLTLGLGVGAVTTMFGVLDALFLSPPAGVRDADDLARLYVVRRSGWIKTKDGGPGSYLDYQALRNTRGFSDMAAFRSPTEVDLDRGEAAQRITGQVVTEEFFHVLGLSFAHGRAFVPDDSVIGGANPVVVIGNGFWKRHFNAAPDVLGRTLLLNGTTATVIGVAPEGFTGLDTESVDVWVPASAAAPLGLMWEGWKTVPYSAVLHFIGRMVPGTAPEHAQSSASAALRHAAEGVPNLDPDPAVLLGSLNPARGPQRSQPASVALWLALITGLVLLIACANVANLLLARALARRREIAVRLSLGVTRSRLVRQLLTESLVLALLGGGAGILFALWGTELIGQFPLPPAAGRLDLRMLAFALTASTMTGLLFGLVPALQAVRIDPILGLRDGSPSAPHGRNRLRNMLVTGQVALAFLMLAGAGLFLRSLDRVLSVDAGVDLDRVALIAVDLERAGYDAVAREAFWSDARERLNAIPGVEHVSSARVTPMSGVGMAAALEVPGPDPLVIDGEGPYLNWISPDYLRTLGMSLIAGRDLNEGDREGAPPVALVNLAMAKNLAPDGQVVGRCLLVGEQVEEGGCTRIVGVVENWHHRLLEGPVPYVLLPWLQHPETGGGVSGLLVRTKDDPQAMLGTIRDVVQGLSPELPFVSVQPMEELVRDTLLPFRIGATLSTLFGFLGLGLAALGLYGTLSYLVAERTHEIGIRRSLGAQARDMVWTVVRRSLGPVVLGLTLGLAGALAGTQLLRSLLYDVAPRDPIALLGAAGVLLLAAILASLVPARRAARVDPLVALRAE